MKLPSFDVRPGTMDDAFTLGYVLSHSTPFKVSGICLAEEFIGDGAQEIWECWSDRKQLLMFFGLTLVAVIVTTVVCLLGHIGLLPVIPVLGIGCAFALSGQGQNGADEIMSHAISARASMRFENMSLERARVCFRDNLKGYDSLSGVSVDVLERRWSDRFVAADKWLDQHPEVIAFLRAEKAKNWPGVA